MTRQLWTRRADTPEGNVILNEAREYARMSKYQHLSDGELIRVVAYQSY